MIEFQIGRLAQQLGVHRNTVTNWIKSGKLHAETTIGKRYLIEAAELRRFCMEARIPDRIINSLTAEDNGPAERAVQPPPATKPVPIRKAVSMPRNPVGAVMVVGGGIAGIQASLDLANAGYAVHLVERSAGIGGAMAQLDKTYPTNDCAM